MTGPNDNVPMTKEEKIREDYFSMEKYAQRVAKEEGYFSYAAELARREARRVRAEKLIEFLKRPENS